MSRIDDLLASTLQSGRIPSDASEAERAELQAALETSTKLQSQRALVQREAVKSMPAGRARFERFVQEQKATPVATAEPRRGFLGRLLAGNRLVLSLGTAVAVAAIAIVAVFASQGLLSSTDTANALSADDYVQVQGVVSSATTSGDQQTVQLSSELGPVTVLVSTDTSTVDETTPNGVAALKAGDTVLVGGLVTAVSPTREITASTVAISQASAAPPTQVKLKVLKKLLPNLQGRISVLSVAKDGESARVVIAAASGERYVVRVDGKTAESLLQKATTAIGTEVSVGAGIAANDGVFSLTVVGSPGQPGAATSAPEAARPRLTFAGVKGVIVGREGDLLRVVDADRKVVVVSIRSNTRIMLGTSGLTLADVGRAGRGLVIDHTVAVSGGIDAATGQIDADVIVIGPKFVR